MPNKISSLPPELVFRQVPGKSVQRARHPWRAPLRFLLLLNPPTNRVIRIVLPPPRLRLRAQLRTACPRARSLPSAYSGIRPEPSMTDRAWTLAGHPRSSHATRPSVRCCPNQHPTPSLLTSWHRHLRPTRCGPFLASRAGSIFASAEGLGKGATVIASTHDLWTEPPTD
jgi:hypothetical protein